MKVLVINKHGQPLMPTTPRKARILLQSGKVYVLVHSLAIPHSSHASLRVRRGASDGLAK